MALKSASVLADALKALKPDMSKPAAVKKFVDEIGDYMDEVQAGSTGSKGIFKLNRPAMVSILLGQGPVMDTSWAPKFADAWEAGVLAAAITPGTVVNPAWVGSGSKDIATPGIGAAAIITIPAGKAILMAKLMTAKPTMGAPITIAEAVKAGTEALMFLNIGLSAPPPMAPTPIPAKAQ
jgi:hypothetical protein